MIKEVMAVSTLTNSPTTKDLPRVLLVDDDPDVLELLGDVIAEKFQCNVAQASSIADARKLIETSDIDLMVADVHLPDGDGTQLVTQLHKDRPAAGAVVITGQPSVESAIRAIRSGAVDLLPKPFKVDDLTERLERALKRTAIASKHEARIDRLRAAVRKLNDARRTVSKKVDLLCNDLVSAYGELSRQLEDVRTQENFRKLIGEAKDLEQLLCHMMDWLLRQLGYSNVAVWLMGENGEYQLGAYMKYTVAGDPAVTEALQRVILPAVTREGFMHVTAAELREKFKSKEMKALGDQEFLAVNCTYLGETLAAIVFFRDTKSPFTLEDSATLKAISPVFATALAGMVRGIGEQQAKDHHGEDGPVIDLDRDDEDRAHDSDWWKRGEPPPF